MFVDVEGFIAAKRPWANLLQTFQKIAASMAFTSSAVESRWAWFLWQKQLPTHETFIARPARL